MTPGGSTARTGRGNLHLRQFFELVGIKGVSVTVLFVLFGVVMYATKARHAGAYAGRGVAVIRWIAVSRLVLGLAGVISFNPDRAHDLARVAARALPIGLTI